MFSSEDLMLARSVRKDGELFSPQEEILITFLSNSMKIGFKKKFASNLIEGFCGTLGYSWTSIRKESQRRSLLETTVMGRTKYKYKMRLDRIKTKFGF